MIWDPDHYLRFADHRTRPGLELIARIPDVEAHRVVDLGSGTGHLTAILAERWPQAAIIGIDASEAMIRRARAEHPDLEWVLGNIRDWEAEAPVDVIFSNATLTGEDPVWNWVTGSVLSPVLATLEEPDRERFGTLCRARYAAAYPPDGEGVTTLPYHRLFIVARAL